MCLSCSNMSDSCDPIDWSQPGSSVHGILQARILEWAAIPFSLGSSLPRDGTWVSCIADKIFRDCCLDSHHCPMSFDNWFVASRSTSSTPYIWIKCLSSYLVYNNFKMSQHQRSRWYQQPGWAHSHLVIVAHDLASENVCHSPSHGLTSWLSW